MRISAMDTKDFIHITYIVVVNIQDGRVVAPWFCVRREPSSILGIDFFFLFFFTHSLILFSYFGGIFYIFFCFSFVF